MWVRKCDLDAQADAVGPIPSVICSSRFTSNAGHCLWTGIAAPARARPPAEPRADRISAEG